MRAGMKPLRRPVAWLVLWWLAIAVVVILSLTPPVEIPQLPSGSDKIEHALVYGLLAAAAVQLFRRGRWLWTLGLGLIALGVALEFAQGAFTTDRMQDPWDAIANSVGVVLGLATAFTPMRDWLLDAQARH